MLACLAKSKPVTSSFTPLGRVKGTVTAQCSSAKFMISSGSIPNCLNFSGPMAASDHAKVSVAMVASPRPRLIGGDW